MLVLRGEPGIGKTALLDYARSRAHGMTVASARGVESESQIPFSTVDQLLRPVIGFVDALPPPQAAALRGALALGPPVAADPFAVSAATLALLAAAAEDAPLLAIVDDSQWVDTASGQALSFAARRLAREGVALLVTVRTGLPSRLDLNGLPTLELGGLEDEHALDLLEQARTNLEPEMTRVILRTARGNPLALLTIPSLLGGTDVDPARADVEPLPVGEALGRAFAREIEARPEPVRLALVVVAAAGESAGLVADALGELGVPSAALDEAEAAGIISLAPRFGFRHPLVLSAAYHGAPPATRRLAHRALATVLRREGDPLQRAWHLALAAAGANEEAAATLADAGDHARARTGVAAAATAYERAAELTPDRELRSQRLADAARDWLLAGRMEHARELLATARRLTSDPGRRATIDELRARCNLMAGEAAIAHSLMVEAADELNGVAPGQGALLLAQASIPPMLVGHTRQALETAERAAALAAAHGGDALFVAELTLAQALFLSGERRRAEALVDRWLPILEAADPLGAHQLIQGPAATLIYLERYDEARRVLGRVVEAARAASALTVLPLALAANALLDFRTGNWAAARAAAAESLRLAEETRQANMIQYPLSLLARLDAAEGDVESCRRNADRAFQIGHPVFADAILEWAGAPLGLLALSLGDYEGAIDHLEPVARKAAEHGLENPAFTQWPPDHVEAYVRARRVEEAHAALETFARRAERTELVWARAAVARCRGLLATDDEFESAFEQALAWHDLTPTPFERARTELCLGERRRRVRRRAEARLALRSALRAFERLGARPWAERARAELRLTGEKVETRPASALASLTEQELQVALVVGAGATNREAAATLFLSPKTIEFHLRNVYLKLGIRSRSELAHFLARDDANQEPAAG